MTIAEIKASTVRVDRFGVAILKDSPICAFFNMACDAIESRSMTAIAAVQVKYANLSKSGVFDACTITQDAYMMVILEELKKFNTGQVATVKEVRHMTGEALQAQKIRKDLAKFAKYEFELELED